MKQTKAKRYVCSYCKSKRVESKMIKIKIEGFSKKAWICSSHASSFKDVLLVNEAKEKPVFVELFSGSGHVSKIARSAGFNTITIDFEKKFEPNICIDILNLRRSLLPGSVHVVWASIPCTTYSILSLEKHWKKIPVSYRKYHYTPKTNEAIQALRILSKTISLILKLKPIYYFIENPRGALRHFPHLSFVPFRHTVSYENYGFSVYKPTDIFTNCEAFKPKIIKTSVNRVFEDSIVNLNTSYERSLIPPKLISEVIESVKFVIK